MKNRLYAEAPLPKWQELADNPLITRLNIIENIDEFQEKMSSRPDLEADLSSASAKTRKYKLEFELYLPSIESWQIYQDISAMIELGYSDKNIKFPSYHKRMNEAIFNAVQVGETVKGDDDEERGVAGSVIGPAGFGKSRTVKQMLTLFGKTIAHEPENCAYHKPFIQVPWIMRKVNSLSARWLLRDLLKAIDERVGTKYFEDNPLSKGVGGLLNALKTACWTHGVGLIVLDEAQFLATSKTSTDKADAPNAKFLQSIYNTTEVPVLLIGTPELRTLTAQNNHTVRRFEKDCRVRLENCAEDSEFWNDAVDIYLQKYVFTRPLKLNGDLRRKIYVYTQGNFSALEMFCKCMIDCIGEVRTVEPSLALFQEAFDRCKSTLLTMARRNHTEKSKASKFDAINGSNSSVGKSSKPSNKGVKRESEPKLVNQEKHEQKLNMGTRSHQHLMKRHK